MQRVNGIHNKTCLDPPQHTPWSDGVSSTAVNDYTVCLQSCLVQRQHPPAKVYKPKLDVTLDVHSPWCWYISPVIVLNSYSNSETKFCHSNHQWHFFFHSLLHSMQCSKACFIPRILLHFRFCPVPVSWVAKILLVNRVLVNQFCKFSLADLDYSINYNCKINWLFFQNEFWKSRFLTVRMLSSI